jgi:hypothetical protein
MPLSHVLWRIRGSRDVECVVRIKARCDWPGCATQVEFILPLTARSDTPSAATCVICRKELRILSAVAVANARRGEP